MVITLEGGGAQHPIDGVSVDKSSKCIQRDDKHDKLSILIYTGRFLDSIGLTVTLSGILQFVCCLLNVAIDRAVRYLLTNSYGKLSATNASDRPRGSLNDRRIVPVMQFC